MILLPLSFFSRYILPHSHDIPFPSSKLDILPQFIQPSPKVNLAISMLVSNALSDCLATRPTGWPIHHCHLAYWKHQNIGSTWKVIWQREGGGGGVYSEKKASNGLSFKPLVACFAWVWTKSNNPLWIKIVIF